MGGGGTLWRPAGAGPTTQRAPSAAPNPLSGTPFGTRFGGAPSVNTAPGALGAGVNPGGVNPNAQTRGLVGTGGLGSGVNPFARGANATPFGLVGGSGAGVTTGLGGAPLGTSSGAVTVDVNAALGLPPDAESWHCPPGKVYDEALGKCLAVTVDVSDDGDDGVPGDLEDDRRDPLAGVGAAAKSAALWIALGLGAVYLATRKKPRRRSTTRRARK